MWNKKLGDWIKNGDGLNMVTGEVKWEILNKIWQQPRNLNVLNNITEVVAASANCHVK